MIVWRGFGIFSILIAAAFGLLFSWILPLVGADTLHEDTPLVFSLFISGIIVWFLGKKLNRDSEKILVDQETGTQYKAGTRHSLLFIPMQLWGPIFIIGSIYMLVKILV